MPNQGEKKAPERCGSSGTTHLASRHIGGQRGKRRMKRGRRRGEGGEEEEGQ